MNALESLYKGHWVPSDSMPLLPVPYCIWSAVLYVVHCLWGVLTESADFFLSVFGCLLCVVCWWCKTVCVCVPSVVDFSGPLYCELSGLSLRTPIVWTVLCFQLLGNSCKLWTLSVPVLSTFRAPVLWTWWASVVRTSVLWTWWASGVVNFSGPLYSEQSSVVYFLVLLECEQYSFPLYSEQLSVGNL